MTKRRNNRTLFCAAIAAVCAAALATVGIFSRASVTPKTVEAASSYSYTSFTSVPSDWTINDKCDTANSSISVASNALTITNTGTTAASVYYGACYQFATADGNVSAGVWSDFSLSVNLSFTSVETSSRWFGIMYHTRTNEDGYLEGYMMNARQNGLSASSCVWYNDSTSAITFTDATARSSGLTAPVVGTTYTYQITVQGNIASHWANGVLVKTYDLSTQDTYLGETYEDGGFAFIVNRASVTISSITITDLSNKSYAKTYQADTGIVGAPTVVCDVTDMDTLTSLTAGERKPSNAILEMDGSGYVLDSDGNRMNNLKFLNVYQTYLKGSIVPIVRVESSAAATTLASILGTNYIHDISVISTNPACVKRCGTCVPTCGVWWSLPRKPTRKPSWKRRIRTAAWWRCCNRTTRPKKR